MGNKIVIKKEDKFYSTKHKVPPLPTQKKNLCYCSKSQKYCGNCDICGANGHVRHYPGPVPYTGCWCDFHYDTLKQSHTLK